MSQHDELTDAAADLAAVTTAWTDQWWDDDVGLLWMPPDPIEGPGGPTDLVVPEPGLHLLPQTTWYAVGLLLRDGPGDRARAAQAIATVLDHQYDAPDEVWHGTFALVHEIAPPTPGARMWVDYDPNWRQFIGCTLLLVLDALADRVPAALVDRIDHALRSAVEGEAHEADGRRVADSYSNIALMHAFLEVEAGRRLGVPAWIASGEARAARVVARFDRFGAFDEYNSPTYHGIDLKALGLWRGHSTSAVLREQGARLEATLWRDSVRWYHAALGQVAGPYTRSYGMDLGAYVAAWSIWVWGAVGREATPIPDVDRPLTHGMDLTLGPVAALIGSAVPDDALADLVAFTGERVVSQRISGPGDGDRVATAWLGEQVALGAERNQVDLSWWDQFYAATAHWARPGGGTGWLRAIVPGPSDTTVEPGVLTLCWHHGAEPEPEVMARFELAAPLAADDPVALATDGVPLEVEAGGTTLLARPGPGPTTTFTVTVTAR